MGGAAVRHYILLSKCTLYAGTAVQACMHAVVVYSEVYMYQCTIRRRDGAITPRIASILTSEQE